MCFQCGFIVVLLVEAKPAGIFDCLVPSVEAAPRLATGVFLHQANEFLRLSNFAFLHIVCNDKDNHRSTYLKTKRFSNGLARFVLRLTWEYHADNFLGLVQLACSKILLRHLRDKGAPALYSWTPQESQVESCEHQDDSNIHCQPFPESVSKEHEIYSDYDGCHSHHVKHDRYLFAHFSPWFNRNSKYT
jgi:hypothetical protein